jgi:protein-S-isoprenylcysteine O-methyltransferase Ste14
MVSKAPPVPPNPGVVEYVLVVLSIGIGVGSLIVFTVFLFIGPFGITDLGLGVTQALTLNAFLCAAFFLQHSGMIRRTTRRWMTQVIPKRYYGVLFSIASGITLLAILLLWQETPPALASADGIYRWSFRAVFFLAVAAQAWATWALRSADLFGTESLLRRSGPTSPPEPMIVRGPYRWVRHPVYSTTLMMIWSFPDLTSDRLLFNVLFTGWIIVGAFLEERDLVETYGTGYRDYQRRVPMLIPSRKSFEA